MTHAASQFSQINPAVLHKEIVDSSLDAIISKNLQGIVLSWNRAAEEIFGFTAQEMIGQPLLKIFPKDRVHEEEVILKKLATGQKVENFRTIRRKKDGTLIDISATISPIYNEEGVVIGASKIARDITELNQKRIISERLEAIVNSSDDAIISKDLTGIVQSWNLGAQRIFGYTAEEMVGQPMIKVFPEDKLDEEPVILAKIARGEKVDHFRTIRERKDGSQIHVSVSISPIYDDMGKVVGASKIARDISTDIEADRLSKQFVSVVESSNEAIISIDLAGNVKTWNPAAEKLFELSRDQMIGNSFFSLLDADQKTKHQRLLRQLSETKSVIDHSWFFTKQLTKGIFIYESLSPILDDKNEVSGVSIMARDYSKEADDTQEKELIIFLMHRMMKHEQFNTTALDYFLQPSVEMCGDMVSAGVSSQSKYYAMLTDATGHGLPAAINLLPINWIFYTMIQKSQPIGVMANEMNQRVYQQSPIDRFAAGVIICVDPHNLIVDVWNGGMPDALLISESGEVKHRFRSSAMPLGIAKYPRTPNSEIVKCEPTDHVIAFTDGLTDVLNRSGEALSQEQIEQLLAKTPSSNRVTVLKQTLEKHLMGKLAEDDVSVLSISVQKVIDNFG